MPTDLALPLALRVERLQIERAEFGTLAAGGFESTLELTGIAARLASDGERHALETLRFATARLAVEASATLAGRPPFAITAGARLTGEERGHAVALAVGARGSLEDLAIELHATGDTPRLDGEARLAPFAEQILRRASLSARGLDPATWVDGAPHAQLSIDALATPQADRGGKIGGEISASNEAPGRLDEQRLPLASLHATLAQEDGREGWQLRVPAFTARFAAGKRAAGELSGTALWADGQLAMDGRLAAVDAAAWHRLAKRTGLEGTLKIQASATAQQVQAQLRDSRFRLELDATHSEGAVHIATARIATRGGSLDLAGQVALAGAYALQGRLHDFDPALFADVPRARLNATLDAQGRFGDEPSMDLHFVLGESTLDGHPLAGRGDVVLRPQVLERAEVSLRGGDNRLEAHGRLGQPADRLTVAIDAPRLDQIGADGVLRGEVTLSGRLTAPEARWTLAAPRLALRGTGSLRELASRGHWSPEGGEVSATLAVASLAAEGKLPPLAAVSASIEGRRSAHRLQLQARVGDMHTLTLAASGGLGEDKLWTGRIETLAWAGPQPLRLVGSTSVQAGAGLVVVGEAAIAGEDWRANLDALRWQAGQLQSSGRFSALPAALLLPPAQASATLRLGGEWNVDFGQRAEGRVRVFRQSGDVTLLAGGKRLALGLGRLALDADFGGQQAALAVHAAGERVGTLEGKLTAALHQEEGRWALARHAPWQGNLRLDTPSIAWLSPLAGENLLLDGRLQAGLDIGGTPAAPATTGQVAGEALRVRLLDSGLDLGGGTLRLDFTPERARLRRLELISVATQGPRERRLDFGRLIGRPGRVTAEGEIAFADGASRIDLRAEQLVVSQLPDRWIMVSGSGGARMSGGRLALAGDLRVDAAYVELPPPGQPKLSSDVVVLGRKEEKPPSLPVGLNLTLNLGERFRFQGAGIDSRLAGELRLTAERLDQLRAYGYIRTENGVVEAYGRKLAIERGILNFQGQVDNPGLNVRALRENLQVEAGVEVTGTVKAPKVRLVSVPDVPDSEKLSWMLLGRAPGANLSSQDADLLLSAAMALRGNQGKGPLDSIQQRLGLEELGISSGTLSDPSRFPSSHVAGSFTANGTTTAEQIATVGKRIGTNTVLSYERSLTTAESILKLTVELTRRLSLVGRIGADNAVGLNYSLSFGGEQEAARGEKSP